MNIDEFINTRLAEVQKPSWYVGGEYGSVVKNKEAVNIRFAFCFPDMYDVGMSHLGMKILYHMMNDTMPDVWCERVFMPNTDMQQLMRENDISLFGLESHEPIKNDTPPAIKKSAADFSAAPENIIQSQAGWLRIQNENKQ